MRLNTIVIERGKASGHPDKTFIMLEPEGIMINYNLGDSLEIPYKGVIITPMNKPIDERYFLRMINHKVRGHTLIEPEDLPSVKKSLLDACFQPPKIAPKYS